MASKEIPSVHVASCLEVSCEEQYSRLCSDLEVKGIQCVVETRGDYGLGSKPFKDKFREKVRETHFTVIHLCPKMLIRLEQDVSVLEGVHHLGKFVFLQVPNTPDNIPPLIRDAVKLTLYNDNNYNHIVATLVKNMTSYSKPVAESATPIDDEEERFVNIEGMPVDDGNNVCYLSSMLKYTPGPLLRFSGVGDIRDMSCRTELYTNETRQNTGRWLLTKVLPEVAKTKDVGCMLALFSVPVVQIKKEAIAMFRNVLVSGNAIGSHLQKAEIALYELLKGIDRLRGLSVTEVMCVYLITLCYRLVHICDNKAALERVLLRLRNVNNFLDLKTFSEYISTNVKDIVNGVENRMVDASKKDWPLRFAAILGTISQMFQGDGGTRVMALQRLPKLLTIKSSGKIWKRSSAKQHPLINKLVTIGVARYLQSLDDTIGEDIDKRIRDAFEILQTKCDVQEDSVGLLKPLLFSKIETVGKIMRQMFISTHQPTLSRLLVSEVTERLYPINIDLADSTMSHDNSAPISSWKVFQVGRLAERGIIHVYVPKESQYNIESSRSDNGHRNTMKILSSLLPNPNILSLWCFQQDTQPVFYVTEDYNRPDLLKVLFYKAKHKKWFQRNELIELLKHAMEAVIYLHNNDVVHRDITASSFYYDQERSLVKLFRFDLARKCARDQTVVERDCKGIPTLWSAPESLGRCHFSFRSDRWMVGHLMYEVITHGCLPYSDLQDKSTEDVVELIKTGKKRLHQEGCIPTKVFETIQQCTELREEERLSAMEAKSKLEETLEYYRGREPMNGKSSLENMYPGLSRMATGGPHRGLAGKYATIASFERAFSIANLSTLEGEYDTVIDSILKLPGVLDVCKNGSTLEIRERCRHNLSQDEESFLLSENLPGLQDGVRVTKIEDGEALVYSLPARMMGNLRTLVEGRILGTDTESYLECLGIVAGTAARLHSKGWLHGCLSMDNVWLEKTDGSPREAYNYKVYFSEFAQLMQSRDKGDGCIVGDYKAIPKDEKVYRRSPPEVIKSGIYSIHSDVYSVGLIVWETMAILSSDGIYPMENRLLSISKHQLYEHLTTSNGCIQPKPSRCSDGLYSLLRACWSPDHATRPFMNTVQLKLSEFTRPTSYDHDLELENDMYEELSIVEYPSDQVDHTTYRSDIQNDGPPSDFTSSLVSESFSRIANPADSPMASLQNEGGGETHEQIHRQQDLRRLVTETGDKKVQRFLDTNENQIKVYENASNSAEPKPGQVVPKVPLIGNPTAGFRPLSEFNRLSPGSTVSSGSSWHTLRDDEDDVYDVGFEGSLFESPSPPPPQPPPLPRKPPPASNLKQTEPTIGASHKVSVSLSDSTSTVSSNNAYDNATPPLGKITISPTSFQGQSEKLNRPSTSSSEFSTSSFRAEQHMDEDEKKDTGKLLPPPPVPQRPAPSPPRPPRRLPPTPSSGSDPPRSAPPQTPPKPTQAKLQNQISPLVSINKSDTTTSTVQIPKHMSGTESRVPMIPPQPAARPVPARPAPQPPTPPRRPPQANFLHPPVLPRGRTSSSDSTTTIRSENMKGDDTIQEVVRSNIHPSVQTQQKTHDTSRAKRGQRPLPEIPTDQHSQ